MRMPCGAEPHGGLDGPLHGAAERHAALELLGDRVGHERGVDLGLAHLDDVDDDFGGGQLADHLAELVDVGALLADHHARTGGVDRHAALLVRTLDHDLGDRGLLQRAHELLADLHVLVKQLGVFGLVGEPARVPGPVDAETQADRIDFLTHGLILRPLLARLRAR